MRNAEAPRTAGDIAFLRRVATHDGPLFARGPDARRARRMREAGLLRGGHLGERYVQLTDEGRNFLRRANGEDAA